MGELPNDIDRAAIEEHAQRTVEQTALRKVRKTLDEIEQAEAAGRRTLRAVLGAWFFWGFLFSGGDLPKQQPMNVPGALQPKQ